MEFCEIDNNQGDISMTRYEQGFLTKCAEAGVPQRIAIAFLKKAQKPDPAEESAIWAMDGSSDDDWTSASAMLRNEGIGVVGNKPFVAKYGPGVRDELVKNKTGVPDLWPAYASVTKAYANIGPYLTKGERARLTKRPYSFVAKDEWTPSDEAYQHMWETRPERLAAQTGAGTAAPPVVRTPDREE